jgi:predicted nucleic acid-binding protein
MMLIDTSLLVDVFRDKSGKAHAGFKRAVGRSDYVLTRMTQLELLQGAKTESEWDTLEKYLDGQDYVEAITRTWSEAARTYFELRGKGFTVSSVLDCLIAQIAIERRLTLLHNDRDFELIAQSRPLRQSRIFLLA